MILSTLQSDKINENWGLIEPFIQKVLKKTDLWYTIEDIYKGLLTANMQLWTSLKRTQIESICITQIVIHPNHKSLEIILHAGNGKDSFQFLKPIEQWGKSQGCEYAIIKGRKGWIRKLPDYCLDSVTLKKEL